MTQYVMPYEDYIQFFNKDTKLKKDKCDIVILNIEGMENKKDKEYEYSIKWCCDHCDESGEIKGINTSSVFSMKTNYWSVEDQW